MLRSCCALRLRWRFRTPQARRATAIPSRPITLVVSYPAGGLSDLPARALAPELQARLGVPVVIENRVGGSGMVAGAHVARSEPNGYTLLVTSSANVTNPQGVQMPYDVVADFAPVGMILEGPPLILISNPCAALQVGGGADRATPRPIPASSASAAPAPAP